ncbi:hypothetical protein K2173_014010 [Erythroxylum novogranatense]|uniref:Germin-like protein n=1 Tax=Erythroxylum novogranatense TaxID=1862640 RepID=A0AAV8SDH9_9ROSI|nr:hypothetical protein K2173_014010 [Erythroxylum novogranatense]
MASSSAIFASKFLSVLVASTVFVQITIAADPDILSDFIVPPNVTNADGSFFTFSGLRSLVNAQQPQTFQISKVGMNEFPALNGQSVSYAVLQFPGGTANPPHTHPRAAELLFLVDGFLQVGFVDSNNKLYFQTLETGDIFVFPKGLVHFQYNVAGQKTAVAISAFGSANAGTVSLPNTLFSTGIDDTILANSFKTDTTTIQALKKGLSPQP